ncbi:sucrase ferredoxin [Nostocaceae cyanobacterium CENA357]|uniref:Sucrase ferredoxin n=1 Tax=Atlanticothrix silvestris CENA357 TaxID=1725252 RepID=A0A8J7HKD6_9CYAN|nr:sucrase ferredoxin [Atlanticothrix silvestris]MBH8554268.1 sucrase ferredoxin [Atlanticothrix silvestris CENA357]
MLINETLSDCRFCSVISQNNGEDPIGSAGTPEYYLIIEAAPPWPVEMWLKPQPMSQQVLDALSYVWAQGIKIRQLAIAPDRQYSIPGYKHVFHYRRPAGLFAEYEKQEFIVPDSEIGALALALTKEPEKLSDFANYRQDSHNIRELLVCTHGNLDVACSRFGYPIYQKLRSEYATNTDSNLRVWRCSHIGGHQFAPTLIDLPIGHYWGHLRPEILNLLVRRNGSVKELYPYYRGWGGLDKFAQIVEREIWMQEGWSWLEYQKSGQVLAYDQVNQEWADVRIDFTTQDGSIQGIYEAKVEVSGYVMTAFSSGENEPLEKIKQYCVSHLWR